MVFKKIILAFMCLGLLSLVGCKTTKKPIPSTPTIGTITGTISYLDQVKTPTPFWAEVELCELKKDGTVGKIVAKMMVESPSQMPVDYRLRIDPSQIDKNKDYGLIARIFVNFDRIMWQNEKPKPAFQNGSNNHIDIIVTRFKEEKN